MRLSERLVSNAFAGLLLAGWPTTLTTIGYALLAELINLGDVNLPARTQAFQVTACAGVVLVVEAAVQLPPTLLGSC
jgi:hypothetical protein